MGLAMLGAFALAVAITSEVSVPWSSDEGARFALGVGCAIVAAFAFTLAWGFVSVALRSLVEVAYDFIALLNWGYCMAVALALEPLMRQVSAWNLVPTDDLQGAALAMAAAVLFVADVAIALVLYPFARIAGSVLGEA